MAGRSSHAKPLDSRWSLVETRDGLGRACVASVPRVGARFGSLVVLASEPGKYGQAKCRCDCGSVRSSDARELRRGRSACASCGWKRAGELRIDKELASAFSDSRVRQMWGRRYKGIIARCHNPRHAAYRNYGGRGIRVCAEWRRSRLAFFQYAKTLVGWDNLALDIDRINNDKGYQPGNIRLCSRSENARNRRGNTLVAYLGTKFSAPSFAERFCPKWTIGALYYHLANGRSAEWIVDRYRKTRTGVGLGELRASQPLRGLD